MSNNIEKTPGFINMPDKIWPEYRQKIYDYLKLTLSTVITEDDLNILVLLIAEIWGDLYMRAKILPWEIDVDKVSTEHLQALSSIIGYRWNTGLTADQQRESIKLFCLIRRWRGTDFGLANLIRVFGQDAKSYYSSADLRGVEIIEYGSRGPDTVEPNMFPGDIKIRIPELSKILRDSIFDTKLAGTRLIFVYYIFIGIYHLIMTEDFFYNISQYIDSIKRGYDPTIDTYGPNYLDTVISTTINDQLTHAIDNGKPIAGIQILTYYKEPYNNGFILNVPGLVNYRGFIEPDPTIEPDHILYGLFGLKG